MRVLLLFLALLTACGSRRPPANIVPSAVVATDHLAGVYIARPYIVVQWTRYPPVVWVRTDRATGPQESVVEIALGEPSVTAEGLVYWIPPGIIAGYNQIVLQGWGALPIVDAEQNPDSWATYTVFKQEEGGGTALYFIDLRDRTDCKGAMCYVSPRIFALSVRHPP